MYARDSVAYACCYIRIGVYSARRTYHTYIQEKLLSKVARFGARSGSPQLVIHNMQGCPRFARIAECGTCAHDNRTKKVNDRSARPQYPPTTQNGYLPIMHLEDHRLSRLAVLVIAFKSSVQSSIVKVSVRCKFGRL